jgi:hypothetical protein
MRTAHDLHGVGDVTLLLGLIGLATALTRLRLFGSLRNCSETMPFQHLPRDGVDLELGHHGRSPI